MMRPSTESAIETGVSYLVILIVGLFLMFGGAGVVAMEYVVPPPHTTHIAIGGGLSLFGALVLLIGIARKQGRTIIQTIIVYVSNARAIINGRRVEDKELTAAVKSGAITDELQLPPKVEP